MSGSTLQPLQGMSDITAPEVFRWQQLEDTARDIFHNYGYSEIRTPLLEKTSLFIRSLGDTTDVVQKEMYTFEDGGGRKVTLRPEGTASAVRFIADQGAEGNGMRLYYMGPMFRRERPQAGRKRQFHQIGAELAGPASAAADVEMMAMQRHLLENLGLRNTMLTLNTRGLPEDRVRVSSGLRAALEPLRSQLCDDCRRRMDANVLRVLDCKVEQCRAIADRLPPVTDFMVEESREYLKDVQRLLHKLDIPFLHDPRLVRGLDYYTHTVWEVRHTGLGAQDALSAGGRYRIELGGRIVDGIGFACGMERLIMALEAENPDRVLELEAPVWLVSAGDQAFEANLVTAQALRIAGVRAGLDLYGRSVKAQMRAANKAGSFRVVLRGAEELANHCAILKNMQDGSQETIDAADIVARLSNLA